MAGFFNYDNAVITTINKIVDMVLLSLVYVILCIPIITIGPATTALYYAVVKNVRRERSYPFREFFKSFKENFKQGFVINLIFIIIYLVLYVDIQFAKQMTGNTATIFSGIFFGLIILAIAVNMHVYPYLSRFEVTIKQLFKNSFFLAMRHLPSTIFMMIILGAGLFLTWIIPITLFFTPALVVLLQSLFIERIFKKYMPEKSDKAASQGIDQWYLE